MIFIGIDDTDSAESGGTGRVARGIAACLREQFSVLGVSRHQFLIDPRVPYTSNNSGNVIHLRTDCVNVDSLIARVGELLVERCLPGSDPGLCIGSFACAEHPFGVAVQQRLASQNEAFSVAAELGVRLQACGGSGDGVVGALAGVILAGGGNDGRFVEVGRTREMGGAVTVAELLEAGIKEVRTQRGQPLERGIVETRGGRVRPLLQGHAPVLLVEPAGEGRWQVVELGKGGARRKEDAECRQ